MKHGDQIIRFARSSGSDKYYINNLRLIGLCLERTGQIDSALSAYNESLRLSKRIYHQALIAQCYHNIGYAAYLAGYNEESAKAYLEAIKLREELKDSVSLGWSVNNLGLLYWRQKAFNDALNHFSKAKQIFQNKKFYYGLGICINNIGLIHEEKGEYDKALIYYYDALAVNIKAENAEGIGLAYNNIGGIYLFKNILDSAESNLNKSILHNSEINNLEGLELNHRNLADLFFRKKDFNSALSHINTAIALAQKGNLPQSLILSYKSLASMNASMGKYKEAYEYYMRFSSLNDSINFGDRLAKLEVAFGKQKTDKELALLKQQNQINDLEIKRKETLFYFAAILLIIFLAVTVYVIWMNLARKKVNKSLELKNIEITEQKEIIEQKSKDITDSILYAQRIQNAILPNESEFKQLFSDYFILYKPKDIVSGDFYYLQEVNDHIIAIVSDCTGHGVPGAFMSIIGHDLLNQIIKEEKTLLPSKILEKLDSRLTELLNNNNHYSSHDGMDIAICSFNKKTRLMSFCGAGRPLVVIQNKTLKVISGNKFSIGSTVPDLSKKFVDSELTIDNGQSIYLFSDGYADQFGGEKGKKIKTKQLLSFLERNAMLSLKEQGKELMNYFDGWKGALEQVDDVCIMGFKI